MGAEAILRVDVIVASVGQMATALEIRREVYSSAGKPRLTYVLDQFDDRATHFLGSIEGRWVSSARMITNEDQFEMTAFFDLKPFLRMGKCAEIARFAILPGHRNSAVAYAMFRGFYRFALKLGIRYFCIAAMPEQVGHMYEHIGFSKVSDSVMFGEFHALHSAYVLDIDAALDEWSANRPRLLEYFLQPIEGIG